MRYPALSRDDIFSQACIAYLEVDKCEKEAGRQLKNWVQRESYYQSRFTNVENDHRSLKLRVSLESYIDIKRWLLSKERHRLRRISMWAQGFTMTEIAYQENVSSGSITSFFKKNLPYYSEYRVSHCLKDHELRTIRHKRGRKYCSKCTLESNRSKDFNFRELHGMSYYKYRKLNNSVSESKMESS